MRTRVIVVCLSVCLSVCVCYHSRAIVQRLCDKLNLPAKSPMNAKGFQLADFTKKLSFPNYSSGQVGHFQFIEVAKDCVATFYLRVVRVGNGRQV